MIRSTLTHEQHKDSDMDHKPWTREDMQDGTVDRYYKAKKENEAKEEKESDLSDSNTLQAIRDRGTDTEKLKAFNYLVDNNQIEKPKPDATRERVPFPNKLIDKG